MNRKRHTRKHKLVTINARFGDGEKFLGAHMFKGLSAASGWLLKHYPEEFENRDENFEFVKYSYAEARELMFRLINELPESTVKHLLHDTTRLLTGGIIASTPTGRTPQNAKGQNDKRLEASRAFRDTSC